MGDAMLTFYCAVADADNVAMELRTVSNVPVYTSARTVYGHDFGDAQVAEQVTGTLQRAAVSLVVAQPDIDKCVQAVAHMRRGHSFRWVATPVLARGRVV
jgi:hypothetical protein